MSVTCIKDFTGTGNICKDHNKCITAECKGVNKEPDAFLIYNLSINNVKTLSVISDARGSICNLEFIEVRKIPHSFVIYLCKDALGNIFNISDDIIVGYTPKEQLALPWD